MGILKSFFKLFSKNITPGNELDNYLVYFFPVRRGKVKVNAKIEIQPNFNVVVVAGGKITDVLGYGKHRVNGSTMPVTFKNLKLGKPSKRGNYRSNFKAEIYYVNLKRFLNFTYESNDPFYIRSDKFGRVKGYSEGVCCVTVTDAEAFINYLLRTTSKLKPKFVAKKLSMLIGNTVNRTIEKSKINFLDILINPEKINSYLNLKINERLNEYGVSLENIQLNSLKLTEKMQKKVNLFLSNKAIYSVEQKESVNIFEDSEDVLEEFNFEPQPIETLKAVEKEASYEPVKEIRQENYQKVNDYPPVNPVNSISNNESEPVNPIFKRRMGGQPVNIESGYNVKNNDFANTNLNAAEVFNAGNLKQCKYCGKTIESHYKFCPICGFKCH